MYSLRVLDNHSITHSKFEKYSIYYPLHYLLHDPHHYPHQVGEKNMELVGSSNLFQTKGCGIKVDNHGKCHFYFVWGCQITLTLRYIIPVGSNLEEIWRECLGLLFEIIIHGKGTWISQKASLISIMKCFTIKHWGHFANVVVIIREGDDDHDLLSPRCLVHSFWEYSVDSHFQSVGKCRPRARSLSS